MYPMDIIGWYQRYYRNMGRVANRVVSVQIITVLPEYVDFDTAIRYLPILVHRIRANSLTIEFYQMDPYIHDEETVNTLSVLIDVVVR